MTRWRMDTLCNDCPFATSGPGLALRKSLRRGRFAEIKRDLAGGQLHFLCHKTTDETGDGSNRICAGAIEYQRRLGTSSNLERVLGRIDAIFSRKDKAKL